MKVDIIELPINDTSNIDALIKKSKLTKPERRFIKEVWNKEYEWITIPKSWYEALERNNLTSDHHLKVAAYVYKMITIAKKKSKSKLGADISSIALDNITKEYNKVLKLLQFDKKLNSHNKNLRMICNYSDGSRVEAKCKTYVSKVGSEGKPIAVVVKSNTLDTTERTLKLSRDDFSQWQYKQMEEVSIDLISALEALKPKRKNINHVQLIVHFKSIFEHNHYCVSSEYGRVFHIISNLKKEYRQFLTIEGESTLNIDLKASQPGFNGKVLIDDNCPGALEYASILKNTRVYDYLYNKYVTPLNDGESCPDTYKKQYLMMMYMEVKDSNTLSIKKHMYIEFPDIISWIDDYKKKYGYQKLAREMQSIESTFIFNTAKLLNTTTCTIHDSFLVKVSEAVRVCELVNLELDHNNIPSTACIESHKEIY